MELIALRLIHIIGGIFWVGGGMLMAFFLGPVLKDLGPAAGPVMAGMQARRIFTVLPTVAILTMLSGFRLMWILSAGFDHSYLQTTTGMTFAIAGAGALIAFVMSLVLIRPAMLRAGKIAAEAASEPDGPKRVALQQSADAIMRRSGVLSWVVTMLLILSASGMAVARYL